MPPEHFMAEALRRGLYESCQHGLLRGCGPDGKLMVRLREEGLIVLGFGEKKTPEAFRNALKVDFWDINEMANNIEAI